MIPSDLFQRKKRSFFYKTEYWETKHLGQSSSLRHLKERNKIMPGTQLDLRKSYAQRSTKFRVGVGMCLSPSPIDGLGTFFPKRISKLCDLLRLFCFCFVLVFFKYFVCVTGCSVKTVLRLIYAYAHYTMSLYSVSYKNESYEINVRIKGHNYNLKMAITVVS